MEKKYKLEDELDLYMNINGLSYLLKMEDVTFDDLIVRDFYEDFDMPDNETQESINNRIKRYQKIVKILKAKYNYKCQICNFSFEMDNENKYCEAHHLKALSSGGNQNPENVIILCPNHHRMFHYAADKISVGELINGNRNIKIGDIEYIIHYD